MHLQGRRNRPAAPSEAPAGPRQTARHSRMARHRDGLRSDAEGGLIDSPLLPHWSESAIAVPEENRRILPSDGNQPAKYFGPGGKFRCWTGARRLTNPGRRVERHSEFRDGAPARPVPELDAAILEIHEPLDDGKTEACAFRSRGRTNGWNRRSRTLDGSPGPRSRNEIRQTSASLAI